MTAAKSSSASGAKLIVTGEAVRDRGANLLNASTIACALRSECLPEAVFLLAAMRFRLFFRAIDQLSTALPPRCHSKEISLLHPAPSARSTSSRQSFSRVLRSPNI